MARRTSAQSHFQCRLPFCSAEKDEFQGRVTAGHDVRSHTAVQVIVNKSNEAGVEEQLFEVMQKGWPGLGQG